MKIIITSPSLDPTQNVSGISSVAQFIIQNNKKNEYIHFELGKKDNEKGGISRIIPTIKSLLKWNKLLSKHSKATIHYNFPLSKASIIRDPLFIWIARLRRRKIIIHIHGGIFLTASYIPTYLNTILRRVFSLSCPFIVLSEFEKEILKNKFNCKNISVLPNCVDLRAAVSFKKITNNKRQLTIGYLGRITEEKGMEYLLEACARMRQQSIPFILKIAGKEEIKGQYLPRFKKELEEQFIYEGIVSGDKKNAFLKSLDVFILPSFFEGLPMSLIESMSFGVVPITTNVGSIHQILKEGNNGLYIRLKDTESIIRQITKVNADRSLLQYLSQNEKQYIITHFNTQQYIDKLNNIYSQA